MEEASSALKNGNYETATDYAFASLRSSRETYISIRFIIQEPGFSNNKVTDNQSLLDSINRKIQRIDHLREILPYIASKEILDFLSNAKTLFDDSKLDLISSDRNIKKIRVF